MKPKLREHVFRIPVEEGVYFRGLSGSILLKGEDLWPWVEFVAELDGTQTWRQVTKGLPRGHRQVLGVILRTLMEQGFVVDLAKERAHTLTTSELSAYTAPIQYLGEWADSAEYRFETYRRSPILAVGSGLTLTAALRALVQSGVALVDFIDVDGGADKGMLAPLTQMASRLTEWAPTELERALFDGTHDLVLYAGPLDSPWLTRLAELCTTANRPLLAGGVTPDQALILPLLQPGGPVCWTCLRQALTDHGLDLSPPVDHSPALLALAGNKLAYEWMLVRTEVRPASSLDSVISIQRADLRESIHKALPLPSCARCRSIPATQPLALADLVGPVTGYLQQVEPGDLVQAPLAQCEAVLPTTLAAPVERVIAAALSLEEAREQALLAGLERVVQQRVAGGAPGQFAVGRSRAEWLGRGALQMTRAELISRPGDLAWQRLFLSSDVRPELHRHLKALRLWFNLQAELLGAMTPVGPAVSVTSGPHLLAVELGTHWSHAAGAALIAALHAAQQGRAPLADSESLQPTQGEFLLAKKEEVLPDWEGWLAHYGQAVSGVPLCLAQPIAPLLCGGWVSSATDSERR